MKKENTITKVYAREILDSRGNPTVEVDVYAGETVLGRAAVPSGASTGEYEALELRDGEKRYFGKGVLKAVENTNEILAKELQGICVTDQKTIDQILLEADGTGNKSNMGANALLGVSMAAAKAAAQVEEQSLYQYLGEGEEVSLPIPMMNLVNGGVHARNNLDFQEFMVLPVGEKSFSERLQIGTEVYHSLKQLLEEEGLSTAVGDEGGFAPNLTSPVQVMDYFMRAVEMAGYEPGEDVVFAMDVAASELYQPDSGMYFFPGESKALQKSKREVLSKPDTEPIQVVRSTEEMIQMYEELIDHYPIVSIEDGLDEEDWDGWQEMTNRIGQKVILVGDDLFVTNVERLKKGVKKGAGNGILIKPNQIGTLSETLETIQYAKKHGYHIIMSHRSGETEDATIADLAVGWNIGYIKSGAPCRGERTAKYNRLLRIEEELDHK